MKRRQKEHTVGATHDDTTGGRVFGVRTSLDWWRAKWESWLCLSACVLCPAHEQYA